VVAKGREKRADTIELIGHTRNPGIYALDDMPTLAKLLPDEGVLAEDIYPLIVVIQRWNPYQLAHSLIAFPLRLVISGDYDRQLEDGDSVHLFSNTQIRSIEVNETHETQNSEIIMAAHSSEQGSALADDPLESSIIADPVLAAFLRERSAFIRGAIRSPGPYPVAERITLDSVLAAAGGLAIEADTRNIEVTSSHLGEGIQKGKPTGTRRIQVNFKETSPADVLVAAGDSVRVNQKFETISDKSVMIIGEVLNPGRYDLIAGDKVSDLIKRAGGLSQQAYPEGAIFSRLSERKAEESRFRSAARDLERSLAASIERDDDKAPDTAQIAMARGLAQELRDVEAVGRITVESDPGILAAQPDLDMLLEAGDRLFIPKRPLTVRVSGEILSPASLQFREDKKPLEYIHQAGGFTFHADKDRTFVLYPNGSAQPLQVSSWNYKPVFIPPGSTIVVPRDPKPFDFVESAKDMSQILSNLAITAIFLDDVRDDE
jgi:protein involved in polysaccharide export with SLBB domain